MAFGPNPKDWSNHYLDMVAVKAKHIGCEREQLGLYMWSSPSNLEMRENLQDEMWDHAVRFYGQCVDNHPNTAKLSKEFWEEKGYTFGPDSNL